MRIANKISLAAAVFEPVSCVALTALDSAEGDFDIAGNMWRVEEWRLAYPVFATWRTARAGTRGHTSSQRRDQEFGQVSRPPVHFFDVSAQSRRQGVKI